MVAIFKGGGAVGVLFATCLIACIVGSVVSNNASALLLYPIVSDLSTTTVRFNPILIRHNPTLIRN